MSTLLDSPIACASCNRKLIIFTGKSETVVCEKCGCVNMTAMGKSFNQGSVKQKNIAAKNSIPLGQELNIQKKNYRVVGFAVLKESGKPYKWVEYSLYNHESGFTTLSEYKGTFNIVHEIQPNEKEVSFNKSETAVLYKTDNYELYNKYVIEIEFAVGEFSYNISHSTQTKSKEFIRPPHMIIYHEKGGQKAFFEGSYVDHKEIEKSLGKSIPQNSFTNPTQPSWLGVDPSIFFKAFMIFAGLVFLSTFLYRIEKPEELIYSRSFKYYKSDSISYNTPIISPSFQLDGWGSNISVKLSTNINNDWFAMGCELVNETNNQSIGFENGTEYYSGYSEGTAWSEGDKENEVNITRIKAGRYHLVMLPIMSGKPVSVSGSVFVSKNKLYYSNYVVVLILAFCIPIFALYKHYEIDKKRWYNSDFSKYNCDE